MSNHDYNYDYYERGVDLGISGYQNYRWLPELTISMCQSMVDFLGIQKSDVILDYGCAKGFIVKAFTELGYDCYGADISEYAINCADENIKHKLFLIQNDFYSTFNKKYDLVICKDVLEHIDENNLKELLKFLRSITKKLFIVVPAGKDEKYIIPEYELDKTHVLRKDPDWWINVLKESNFDVSFNYQVKGIKENWSHYPTGNAFFTCV